MKFLVALSCLLAVACAKPSSVVAPVAYSNVVAHQVAAAPVAYSSAHVVQNYAAQVAHTYAAAPVAHTYAAAPVAHTYAAAPVAHTYAAAPVAHTYAAAPVAHTYAAAPVAHVATHTVAAPAVAHAVAAPVVAAPVVHKTQYHAQNELGQASYGHSEPTQTHNAVQDAYGNKVGSYSYVAPDGQIIAANYVADGLGYRVSSNALPVGPVAVGETAEVVAARAAHLNAHALAKSRARRGVYAYSTPLVHTAYAAPIAYSAPVVRHATLSTVVNTPGHAVSYHVY